MLCLPSIAQRTSVLSFIQESMPWSRRTKPKSQSKGVKYNDESRNAKERKKKKAGRIEFKKD
jgi:hypothetical protein